MKKLRKFKDEFSKKDPKRKFKKKNKRSKLNPFDKNTDFLNDFLKKYNG